jgi:hypothetical protein
MKTKDYLTIVLVPLAVLLIPLIGSATLESWNWTGSDFVAAWFIMAAATFLYRLLATRKVANLAYRLGAGLAVATGFLLTWVNLAVQVIGDDNPGNLLYFLVILGGLAGVALTRFEAARLARLAFALAGALFLVPIISVLAWPADFSPGPAKVFILNGGFVLMFATAGLLFLQAARATTARAT